MAANGAANYALIQDGKVVNVVLWDGETDWNPGDDFTAIDCPDDVGIGWTWDTDNGFQRPEPTLPE